VSLVREYLSLPFGQQVAFGLLGIVFLPLMLPCLLVSLPFAGIRQGGR